MFEVQLRRSPTTAVADSDALWRRLSRLLSLVPLAFCAFIALIILYPIARTFFSLFALGSGLNLSAISAAFSMPGIGQTFLNTIFLVVVSGSSALIVASAMAWLNERTDASIPGLSNALPAIPVLIPPVAQVIGWTLLLAPSAGTVNVVLRAIFGISTNEGPLNIYSWTGLVFLYTLELFPFAFLVISAGLRNLDASLEEASRISGASQLSTLRHITLPAILPVLMSAAVLMLVMGFALFSVGAIVGSTVRVDVLSVRIVRLVNGVYPPRTAEALVLSVVILLIIGGAWLLQNRIARKGRFATLGGKGARATPVRLGIWRWPARITVLCYVAAAVIAPVLALLYVSLQPFWTPKFNFARLSFDAYREAFFEQGQAHLALIDSSILGIVGATLGMIVAVISAIVIRRRRQDVPSRIFDAIFKIPAAIPHIVLAIGILVAFGGSPFFLSGTLFLLLVGYLTAYLPQASLAAASSVSQVGNELVEASRICGAGEVRTFFSVWLPLMLPGIASGWVLLFAMMSGDLTTSVLLANTATPTVGSTLLQQYESGSYPLIAALALLITLTSSTIVLVVLRFAGGGLPAAYVRTKDTRA